MSGLLPPGFTSNPLPAACWIQSGKSVITLRTDGKWFQFTFFSWYVFLTWSNTKLKNFASWAQKLCCRLNIFPVLWSPQGDSSPAFLQLLCYPLKLQGALYLQLSCAFLSATSQRQSCSAAVIYSLALTQFQYIYKCLIQTYRLFAAKIKTHLRN